jgi:hypothetical protein
MPVNLTKLPSGIIHTDDFAMHLRDLHARQKEQHRFEMLALDYIRCASGAQRGSAWWQMTWIPELSAPQAHRHRIGDVEVFIHRQSVKGLRGRCLHYENGQVVIKG